MPALQNGLDKFRPYEDAGRGGEYVIAAGEEADTVEADGGRRRGAPVAGKERMASLTESG
jgi:hypothetical protein